MVFRRFAVDGEIPLARNKIKKKVGEVAKISYLCGRKTLIFEHLIDMKRLTFLMLLMCAIGGRTMAAEFTELELTLPKIPTFTNEAGFGYDLETSWDGKSATPFFISANVPDGNYRVTVTIGSKKRAAETTIRCESRRLFVENLATKKGELVTKTFVVNKRDINFVNEKGQADRVKL